MNIIKILQGISYWFTIKLFIFNPFVLTKKFLFIKYITSELNRAD